LFRRNTRRWAAATHAVIISRLHASDRAFVQQAAQRERLFLRVIGVRLRQKTSVAPGSLDMASVSTLETAMGFAQHVVSSIERLDDPFCVQGGGQRHIDGVDIGIVYRCFVRAMPALQTNVACELPPLLSPSSDGSTPAINERAIFAAASTPKREGFIFSIVLNKGLATHRASAQIKTGTTATDDPTNVLRSVLSRKRRTK
jgi:hypothetical protein